MFQFLVTAAAENCWKLIMFLSPIKYRENLDYYLGLWATVSKSTETNCGGRPVENHKTAYKLQWLFKFKHLSEFIPPVCEVTQFRGSEKATVIHQVTRHIVQPGFVSGVVSISQEHLQHWAPCQCSVGIPEIYLDLNRWREEREDREEKAADRQGTLSPNCAKIRSPHFSSRTSHSCGHRWQSNYRRTFGFLFSTLNGNSLNRDSQISSHSRRCTKINCDINVLVIRTHGTPRRRPSALRSPFLISCNLKS